MANWWDGELSSSRLRIHRFRNRNFELPNFELIRLQSLNFLFRTTRIQLDSDWRFLNSDRFISATSFKQTIYFSASNLVRFAKQLHNFRIRLANFHVASVELNWTSLRTRWAELSLRTRWAELNFTELNYSSHSHEVNNNSLESKLFQRNAIQSIKFQFQFRSSTQIAISFKGLIWCSAQLHSDSPLECRTDDRNDGRNLSAGRLLR